MSRLINGFWLDSDKRWKVKLNKDGSVKSLYLGRKKIEPVIIPLTENMREIIEQRHKGSAPVLLQEVNRFVGVVGDHEIYRGILNHGNG